MWNLIRWVSPRTIKETFVPPRTSTATRSCSPTRTAAKHSVKLAGGEVTPRTP